MDIQVNGLFEVRFSKDFSDVKVVIHPYPLSFPKQQSNVSIERVRLKHEARVNDIENASFILPVIADSYVGFFSLRVMKRIAMRMRRKSDTLEHSIIFAQGCVAPLRNSILCLAS